MAHSNTNHDSDEDSRMKTCTHNHGIPSVEDGCDEKECSSSDTDVMVTGRNDEVVEHANAYTVDDSDDEYDEKDCDCYYRMRMSADRYDRM